MASVECINFRSYDKGHLKGFATLRIPKMGLEIDGFSLWEKDGRRWVNFPSNEYTTKEGEKKYKPIMWFIKKEHYAAFVEEAKKAIDEYIEKNMASPVEQQEVGGGDSNESIPF